jgi:hypothetical protein
MNMSANSSAAAVLNAQCWCIGTDLPGLRATLGQLVAAGGVTEDLATTHPHLFADVPLFITGEQHRRIVDAVAALHRVMAMPAWREAALAGAPALAAHDPGNPGSFLGVDFHLDAAHPAGPDTVQLIELNTNPGGGGAECVARAGPAGLLRGGRGGVPGPAELRCRRAGTARPVCRRMARGRAQRVAPAPGDLRCGSGGSVSKKGSGGSEENERHNGPETKNFVDRER